MEDTRIITVDGNLAGETIQEEFEETTDPKVLNSARKRIKTAIMKQFDGASEVQKEELNHILKRL